MAIATAASLAVLAAATYGEATGQGFDFGLFQGVRDTFFPEAPEPKIPDPEIKPSTLGAAQLEERSLIDKKGLATTKKVKQGLLNQAPKQKLGGTVV